MYGAPTIDRNLGTGNTYGKWYSSCPHNANIIIGETDNIKEQTHSCIHTCLCVCVPILILIDFNFRYYNFTWIQDIWRKI